MTIGSMFHETCYPTQVDALTAACSSVSAFAGDGSHVYCTSVVMSAPTPSSTAGGAFPGQLNITALGPGGSAGSTYTSRVNLSACERYDYAYWTDATGAWVAALVAIVAARFLYLRLFVKETL